MFVGSHWHTIDAKGRLVLPSSFRGRLAGGAFVTPLDSCLAVLPAQEFERMARTLEAQVRDGSVDLNALRSFAAQADHVVPDGQGRMRILQRLRDAVGLGRSVVVIGVLARVEIWDPDRWAEAESVRTERLAEAIAHGRGIGDG